MELYFHGENVIAPKRLIVTEKSSLEEIVLLYKNNFGKSSILEEIFIFWEDEEHPWEDGNVQTMHHHKHIHAHRCRKISVKAIYNGDSKDLHVSPAITGEKLLLKIAQLFAVTPIDASNMILTYGDDKELEKTTHLGSIVKHGECKISLSLIPDPQIKG